MRLQNSMSSSTTLSLACLLASDLFMSFAAAQDLPTLSKGGANDAMPTASSKAAAAASKTASKGSAKPGSKSASATGKKKSAATTSGTASPEATITGSTASGSNSAAFLTSLSSSGANPTSIPLPTIAGQYSYPPPSVPPTANAPYMQQSNLPEGTVFIAVGAGLGFFALSVLAWRGLVAWALHRSVKRAAMAQSISDQKTQYRPPGGGKMYSSTMGSSLSIDKLGFGGRGNAAASTTNSQKTHTPNESLFFSPTAARNSVAGIDGAGNRNSGYLPAGYYAAGNPNQGGNGRTPSGMSQLGGGLMNIGAKSQGYTRARTMAPSPPPSPGLRPTSQGGDTLYSPGQRGHAGAVASSSSSLNLNAPTQGRAPSVYLDDLFDTHQGRPESSGRL